MLKAETIINLKGLGVDIESLKTEITALVIAAKQQAFKEGKDAGLEIANKVFIKKYNLDGVNPKDPEKIIAAMDSKISSIIGFFPRSSDKKAARPRI